MRAGGRFDLPRGNPTLDPKCPVCEEPVAKKDLLSHRDKHFPKGKPDSVKDPAGHDSWVKLTLMSRKE